MVAAAQGIRASLDGNQPGDPKKAVELMIDLVKGEGCAADRAVPLRLPIGRDGQDYVRGNAEDNGGVIDSTEFRRTRASFDKHLYMLSFSTS